MPKRSVKATERGCEHSERFFMQKEDSFSALNVSRKPVVHLITSDELVCMNLSGPFSGCVSHPAHVAFLASPHVPPVCPPLPFCPHECVCVVVVV